MKSSDNSHVSRPMRWILERLYTDCSWAYDPAAWIVSGGLYHKWTCVAEQFVGDGPVLEAGCGQGRLLAHLAGQGHDVIGIDLSPQMAQASQRRLERKKLTGKVICGDARNMPLEDESVGTIINTFPMPYYGEKKTIREYLRVLRPGGRWIITAGPLLRFHPRLIGWYLFLFAEMGFSLGRNHKGTTIQHSPFASYRTELVQAGPTQVPVHIFEKKI